MSPRLPPPDTPASAGTAAPAASVPLAELRAVMAHWAGRGAAHLAPVAWARLNALARRHDAAPPALREALARRWQALQAGLAPTVEAALSGAAAEAPGAAPPPAPAASAPLRAMLCERLGPQAVPAASPAATPAPLPGASGRAPVASPAARSARASTARGGQSAAPLPPPSPVAPRAALPPPLKGVQLFERSWGELQMRQRVHQARAQLPDTAGPLHSQGVLVRALDTLQALSPSYLRRLLRHADALRWLEQAQGADLLEARDVLGAPAPAKRRTRKAPPAAAGDEG